MFASRRQILRLAIGAAVAGFAPSLLAQTAASNAPKSAPAGVKPLMAVNVSGRQRTLALRAARSYAQLGLGVVPQPSSNAMRLAITDFEATLAALAPFCAGKPSAKLLEEQSALWARFHSGLREAPAIEAAGALNDQLEKLVPVCTSTHEQIVREIGTPTATTVSRSGRQRFVSQRAAQLFMFREWGVTRGDYADIETLSAEARKLRTDLRNAPDLSADVKRDIDLAETQWIFFDEALRAQQRGRADDISRRNVATTSERLLEVFDKMTLAMVAMGD